MIIRGEFMAIRVKIKTYNFHVIVHEFPYNYSYLIQSIWIVNKIHEKIMGNSWQIYYLAIYILFLFSIYIIFVNS